MCGVVRTQPEAFGRVTARAFSALENERAEPLVLSTKQITPLTCPPPAAIPVAGSMQENKNGQGKSRAYSRAQ